MIELNEIQTAQVEQILKEQGIKNNGLQTELLDHICCQVEYRMENGMPFDRALTDSLGTFEEDEMKDIQTSCLAIFKQKRFSIMKKVSAASLITMFVICSAFWLNQEPGPQATPPLDAEVTLLAMAEPPCTHPLAGNPEVTSGFGMRMHPIKKVKKMHKGVDFKAPMGTPVQATSDGKIVKAEYHKGYGNHIVIQHDEHYKSLYAQLSRMDVKVGQEVKKGDIIGAVGSSGMSTGPHLHYEVLKDGKNEAPAAYLKP